MNGESRPGQGGQRITDKPSLIQSTDNRQPHTPRVPVVTMTEDRHSCHFDGPERVLRDAVRRVSCPYQVSQVSRRLSVPAGYAERVADAIRTGQHPARVVIKNQDPGLW
jgi:hypothetical protein